MTSPGWLSITALVPAAGISWSLAPCGRQEERDGYGAFSKSVNQGKNWSAETKGISNKYAVAFPDKTLQGPQVAVGPAEAAKKRLYTSWQNQAGSSHRRAENAS